MQNVCIQYTRKKCFRATDGAETSIMTQMNLASASTQTGTSRHNTF